MQLIDFDGPTKPVPTELRLDAGLDLASAQRAREVIAAHTARDGGRVDLAQRASDLRRAVPGWARCADAILAALARPPHLCVLARSSWIDLPASDYHAVIEGLISLIGTPSSDNAYRSGTATDDVRPIDPTSRDVTYSFDCEVHADESSKLRPEDIVTLWCVNQAEDGGGSLVWSMAEVLETLRAMPGGHATEHLLRSRRFPFGGKLRQPPRVLLAPILFGNAGVRFRLGAIRDAFEVVGQAPSPQDEDVIATLIAAVRRTTAYAFTLRPGETSCMLNRTTLHSRASFSDGNRWLIRCRLNNPELSNSLDDDQVGWSDEPSHRQSA